MKLVIAASLFSLLACSSAAMAATPHAANHDTPEARRNTSALNILESQGYAADLQDKSVSGFSDFRAQAGKFVATVVQNGRSYMLSVDPDSGQVTRQN